MNSRLLATIIIFPIWLTLVLVFRKHRQWLLYYLVAAFGFTLQAVFISEYFGWDQLLVNLASFQVSLIGKHIFHFNIELLSGGRFELISGHGSSILKLGIECSAILESLILISLIAFYPLFRPGQKILRILFGLVMTYVINILRLLIILVMAYKLGPDYIFLAHAVVARVFFFGCELLLYWYLITKPTVKSVGHSIQNNITLDEAARIGRGLQLKHAFGQLVAILLVVDLSVISLLASNDWHKSFATKSQVVRPIIYKDETSMTPSLQGSLINQEVTLDLGSGERKAIDFEVNREQSLKVKILGAQKDLAARLIINGQSQEVVSLDEIARDADSIFKPITVKSGDIVQLRLQNLAETKAKYQVKVVSAETAEICKVKEVASRQPTPTPTPTPAPSPVVTPSPTPTPAVAGTAIEQFSREVPLNLEANQKTTLTYIITSNSILDIQIAEGKAELAARLYLNDQEVDFITAAPWHYLKEKSIFDPITVQPGDILAVKLQNLADNPSSYLLKINPEEPNGQ